MDLNHSFTVPASIDRVWETFMDLEEVGGCFPGATVSSVEGDSFKGSVKVKLGPIALVYNGTGKFVERDESAKRARIEAKGKDKRGNGTAGANVSVRLTEEGGGTKVVVLTDLQVTGKPAQFGRGVMQDVSDKLLAQFVDCIESKLAGPTGGTSTESGATPEGAPEVSIPSGGAGVQQTSSAGRPATAAAPAAPAASVAPRHAAPNNDDALDLGTAVLPVVAKQAAPYLGGLLALIVGGWAFKRLRRRKDSRLRALVTDHLQR